MNWATRGTNAGTLESRPAPAGRGACIDRYDSPFARRPREHRFRRHPGGQLLPFHQRCHAVAAVGALPDAEVRFPARVLADRPADHGVHGHRLAAAAGDRALHRQAADALFAAGRHGLIARRPGPARHRAQLRDAADRRRLHRPRLGDFPPGILAGGAPGIGRALRLRAVHLPGRRQCRPGHGPAARRLHRRPLRPGQRCLVRARGAGRYRRAQAGRRLVQRPSEDRASAQAGRIAFPGACRAARWSLRWSSWRC